MRRIEPGPHKLAPRHSLAHTRKCAILAAFSRRRILMAKGQMKSNKEKRKPKQNKDDKKAAKK